MTSKRRQIKRLGESKKTTVPVKQLHQDNVPKDTPEVQNSAVKKNKTK